MAELAAVNTSPLIYLSRAGLIDFLQVAAPRIAVPRAVADELRAWHSADEAQRNLDTLAWLEIVDANPVSPAVLAWDLGPGESAVIAYGLDSPNTELIIDDLAARRCAASFGLPVRGTLGLILAAKRRNLIPSARPILQRLIEAGMYLSPRVLDAALQHVNE